jgi:hypothetical protein
MTLDRFNALFTPITMMPEMLYQDVVTSITASPSTLLELPMFWTLAWDFTLPRHLP